MKQDLLNIVKGMYTHLDNQYQMLSNKGRADLVHNVAEARTPIKGHLDLLVKDLKKENLPKMYTYEHIGHLLQVYDRKEKRLFELMRKLK